MSKEPEPFLDALWAFDHCSILRGWAVSKSVVGFNAELFFLVMVRGMFYSSTWSTHKLSK